MVMADSPEFVVTSLAAMRIGAIPVPASTMSRADGIAELLRDSRARLLAVTREFAAAAVTAAAAAPDPAWLPTDSPLALGPPAALPGLPLTHLPTPPPDGAGLYTSAHLP